MKYFYSLFVYKFEYGFMFFEGLPAIIDDILFLNINVTK